MGVFDTNSNTRQIIEQFVKLKLHNLKQTVPEIKHLKQSESLKASISKHKLVFGGQAGTGDLTKKTIIPKSKLIENMKKYYNIQKQQTL